jgi:exodeoxyribonuclease V alpha subunit
MESIRGIVTHVLFPRTPEQENGRVLFMAQYETQDGLVSGKFGGRARNVRIGDCLLGEGEWDDKNVRNGKPDVMFKAARLRAEMPRTAAGADMFLRMCLNDSEHGIPPSRLQELVKAQGPGVLRRASEKPEMLVALSRDPARFRKAILASWASRTQGDQAISLLEESGLETRTIERILAELSERPLQSLQENPYRVARLPGVGFDNADRVGRRLGFRPDDRKRLTAAVCEVLRREAEGNDNDISGSTSASLDTLVAGLSTVSRIDRPLLLDFLRDAARRDDHELGIYQMGPDQPPVAALLRYYIAEVDIQSGVQSLLSSGRRNPEAQVSGAARTLFEQEDFRRFDAIQRTAVEMAATEPLSILTGGPGTGKSTVMDAVARLCKQMDRGKLFLAAPTGKAAKRLEETTGKPAQTVHSLLMAQGSESEGGPPRFKRGKSNPLPRGCMVVVDEASMLDAETAAALFNAMPPDGRLLLVGDRNQLPSVGAGSVLGDLLSAEVGERRVVPSVELVNVYRQSKDSGIAKGAALIRDGLLPELGIDDRGGVSFQDMPASQLVASIVRAVCDELPTQVLDPKFPNKRLDPLRDVAVLCPMAKGPGGTWEINTALAKRLNPSGVPLPGVASGDGDDPKMPVPKSGDRVMLTKNDSENDVMNGDIGTIVGPGCSATGRPTIRVKFDSGKEVEYPAARWRRLILAYAGTIHKSQGSQYPVVIMPMSAAHGRMLERTLVYTGWTRAQKRLILMGDRGALEQGVKTYKGDQRSTLLRRFLAALLPGTGFSTEGTDWHARAMAAQEESVRSMQAQESAARADPRTAPPPVGRLFGKRTAAASPPVLARNTAARAESVMPGSGSIPRTGSLFGFKRRTDVAVPTLPIASESPQHSVQAAVIGRSLFGARRGIAPSLPAVPKDPVPLTSVAPDERTGVVRAPGFGRLFPTRPLPARSHQSEEEPLSGMKP